MGKKISVRTLMLGFLLGGLIWSGVAFSSEATGRRTYDVEFRGADIRDAVRLLAFMEGQNVVVPDHLERKVTLSFETIEAEAALYALLEANEMGLVHRDGTWRVVTADQLEKLGGDLETVTLPITYSKAVDLLPQVEPLLSNRGNVVADNRTNSLTVYDIRQNIANIRKMLKNVDVPETQVLLEAKVLQATSSVLQSLGIQWGVRKSWPGASVSGVNSVGSSQSGNSLNVDVPALDRKKLAPPAGVGLMLGTLSNPMDVTLTAAEERGDLKIISKPSVVTMNNQAASIKSGIKFFVKTTGGISIGGAATTSTAGGGSIQEIDAGITLTVTPQVTLNDFIKLVINVSQSEPDFAQSVEGIPAILGNTAETTVFLKDGQVTAIGGLIQTKKNYATNGIPVLSALPVLGALFGGYDDQKTQNELIILLRPTIVNQHLSELPEWRDTEKGFY
jgi:type IV pilus assembly protein PilQ